MAPTECTTITLSKTNEWMIEDDNFSFLMEIVQLGRPILVTLLPESIVHASVVNLPEGNFELFGYTVRASKDDAKVKFIHGTIVESSNCEIAEANSEKEGKSRQCENFLVKMRRQAVSN